jgi:hypothetical protein
LKDFIEQQIIAAARGLLTGRVNEILREAEFAIPLVEFGDYGCSYSAAPAISLSSCERTEKERVIRLDSYSLAITFTFIDTPESELYCYAYAGAVGRAVYDDPTLGGVADRAVVTGKKYNSPKNPHCGDDWGMIITLRITIEDTGNVS